MATTTATVVADNSTLANFQSWVAALWNAFTTLGWVQTADTGQSANPPTAVPSSSFVYQIFKANDTNAGTTPIYIKVQVGYNSTNVGIQITVGSGSDGAGNITGPVMGPYYITYSGGLMPNQGASTYPCYFSGDAGSFRAMMWTTSTNAEFVFGVERSRDTSGNATSDYVTIVGANARATAGWFQQSMYHGSSTPGPFSSGINTSNGGYSTGYYSATSKVAAFPIIPMVGYPGNQMLGFVGFVAADVGESNGTTVTVNIAGANHAYLATQLSNLNYWGRLAVGAVAGSVGMLYE